MVRIHWMALATAAFLLPLAAEPIFTAPVTSGEFTVWSDFSSSLKLSGPGWSLEANAWGGGGSPSYVGSMATLIAGQSGSDLFVEKTTGFLSGKMHHGTISLMTKPFLVNSEVGQGNLLVDYDIHIWHCEDSGSALTYCDTLPGGIPHYRFKSSGSINASVKWGKAINLNEGLFDIVYDPVTDTFKDVPYPANWEVTHPTVQLFVPEPGAGALLRAGLAALALAGRWKTAGRA